MRRAPLLLGIAALAALLLLVAPAYAMSNGAPRLECTQCHVDAAQHPAQFVVEGLPSKVEPGKVYKLIIKITKGPESKGAAYGGFAMIATAGKFIIVDPKDTFATTFVENGTKYEGVTHTKAGSLKKEWVVEWKAPQSCNGPIKFIVSVIAANGDGSPMGDWYGYKVITVQCAAAAKPKVTTTTVVETVTTTTVITSTSYTTITKTVSNPGLAVGVAIAIFVIVVAGYLIATRK